VTKSEASLSQRGCATTHDFFGTQIGPLHIAVAASVKHSFRRCRLGAFNRWTIGDVTLFSRVARQKNASNEIRGPRSCCRTATIAETTTNGRQLLTADGECAHGTNRPWLYVSATVLDILAGRLARNGVSEMTHSSVSNSAFTLDTC